MVIWKGAREFDIITGVKQGDVVAPTLFTLFFNAIIATALLQHPHCSVMILKDFSREGRKGG